MIIATLLTAAQYARKSGCQTHRCGPISLHLLSDWSFYKNMVLYQYFIIFTSWKSFKRSRPFWRINVSRSILFWIEIDHEDVVLFLFFVTKEVHMVEDKTYCAFTNRWLSSLIILQFWRSHLNSFFCFLFQRIHIPKKMWLITRWT